MKRMHALLAATMAAISLAGAAPACAQMWGGPGNGLGRGFPGMGMGSGRMGTFHDAATATRGMLDALHARLALAPDQETLWQAFVTAAIAEANDMDDMHDDMFAAMQGTAADRMTARAQIMRERADDAAAVAQAFSAFYNSLTTAQRAIADEFLGRGPMAGPRSGPFG